MKRKFTSLAVLYFAVCDSGEQNVDNWEVSNRDVKDEQRFVSLFSFAATKGKGKGMMKEQLKGPEVCKDPVRLTSYAMGVNIFKQGEDPVLKPTDQYPEW